MSFTPRQHYTPLSPSIACTILYIDEGDDDEDSDRDEWKSFIFQSVDDDDGWQLHENVPLIDELSTRTQQQQSATLLR